MNYCYMLRCADGSLYTGWTTDPQRRLRAHNAGRGAKYTRSRLVYVEECATKEVAMSREWHLNHLTKEEKEALVAGERQ